jgi:hypothetical protein
MAEERQSLQLTLSMLLESKALRCLALVLKIGQIRCKKVSVAANTAMGRTYH